MYKLPHTKITTQQNQYIDTHSGTLQERLILGANQMINAGISKEVVIKDLKNNYKMIDKLNKDNEELIKSGKLEKLTYSEEEIEEELINCCKKE